MTTNFSKETQEAIDNTLMSGDRLNRKLQNIKGCNMFNSKKKHELMRQIIELRKKRSAVDAELKMKIIDLYVAIGFTHDQAIKMV